MRDNYWVVQIEKNGKGKVRLKFRGYFNIPAKHAACFITALVAFGFTVFSIIRYLQ